MTIKVALIRQEQTGSDGGAQAIIDLIVKALNGKGGIDLALLCRKWDVERKLDNKVIINPFFVGRTSKYLSFRNAFSNYLSKNKFDLVQSHERYDGCHIFRAGDGVHKIWLQRKSATLNMFQRMFLAISPYHNTILREERAMFTGESLKKVICNSHMVRNEIIDNFPIAPEKVVVIYNGVDLKKFHPVGIDAKVKIREELRITVDSTVFIFSGSGFERKNLANTIKAFSYLDDDTCLVILGRDKRQGFYESLAEEYQCSDRVIFFGAQDAQSMARFYQAADVLVLPTLYDPFPNVILEGFAVGLPCITSSHCGAVDVIPGNKCGAIIDSHDVEALTKAMTSYLDPKKVSEESVNARKMAENFTQEKMQSELLLLYRDVLNASN